MRSADFVEKRKFKRLGLSLPTRIRYDSDSGKQEVQEGVTLNVSFNGAYISEIKLKNIKDKDTINISLSVPREETRDFPFSRLIGKAKVVRVEEEGVAVEFDEDISRLFVAN